MWAQGLAPPDISVWMDSLMFLEKTQSGLKPKSLTVTFSVLQTAVLTCHLTSLHTSTLFSLCKALSSISHVFYASSCLRDFVYTVPSTSEAPFFQLIFLGSA